MKKGTSPFAILLVCIVASVSFGWSSEFPGFYAYGLFEILYGTDSDADFVSTNPWINPTQGAYAAQGAAVTNGAAVQGLGGGGYQYAGPNAQFQGQGVFMGQGLMSGPGGTSVGGQGSVQGQAQYSPYGSQTSVIGASQYGYATGGASVYGGVSASSSQGQFVWP